MATRPFPGLTPRTALDNRGGGFAAPPFLQQRSPFSGFGGSKPVITPKSTVTPGEVKPVTPAAQPALPTTQPQSAITPAGQPAAKPSGPQTLYEFLKGDLERERDRALAGARTSAAARGVFYGTPLTTSEGDIETSFQRGLGQLSADMLQRQEQNELARLGLAGSLIGPFGGGGTGGIDPSIYNLIGSLLAPRVGPSAITPQKGNKTQSQ